MADDNTQNQQSPHFLEMMTGIARLQVELQTEKDPDVVVERALEFLFEIVGPAGILWCEQLNEDGSISYSCVNYGLPSDTPDRGEDAVFSFLCHNVLVPAKDTDKAIRLNHPDKVRIFFPASPEWLHERDVIFSAPEGTSRGSRSNLLIFSGKDETLPENIESVIYPFSLMLSKLISKLREPDTSTTQDQQTQPEADMRTDDTNGANMWADGDNDPTEPTGTKDTSSKDAFGVRDELAPLIRHELDIEALLRTTLEFLLTKTGPTNAAVFLPTTSGDWSLGAYVNYDNSRETVDVLLDHLANTCVPTLVDAGKDLHVNGREGEINEEVLDAAEWLGNSDVIFALGSHDGEILANIMVFRDSDSALATNALGVIQETMALFSAQLARVIRVHYRHVPKERWGAPGDPEDHDGNDDDFTPPGGNWPGGHLGGRDGR